MPCNKKSFASYTQAEFALRYTRRRDKDKRDRAAAHRYWCVECKAVHIGHGNFRTNYKNRKRQDDE